MHLATSLAILDRDVVVTLLEGSLSGQVNPDGDREAHGSQLRRGFEGF